MPFSGYGLTRWFCRDRSRPVPASVAAPCCFPFVIPAKAGIHLRMRVNTRGFSFPPMRGNPGERQKA